MPYYDITLRLVVAVVCGALVGFDRQRRGHAAGLRTHMLVALGSAVFVLLGIIYAGEAVDIASQGLRTDPMRNVAAIIGGIGFLGAGVIIQGRDRVHGLTTATGLWAVSAIGAGAGMGYYFLVGVATALAFITLALLKSVENDAARRARLEHDDQPQGGSTDGAN